MAHNISNFEGEFWLVINESYFDMAKAYTNSNGFKINLIKSKNTNGSYNTLREVHSQLPDSNLLFVWSDLIFDEKFDSIPEDDVLIYLSEGDYRYKFENEQIKQKSPGNIPGIYFIKKKRDSLFPNI